MATNLFDVKKRKKGSAEEFIKTRFEEHRQSMTDLHRDWALTLAWSRGHQNVDFNSKTKQWQRQTRNPWQTRLISNLILPIVRSKVARMSVFNPIWDVVPATPDPEDAEIAKTSTKVLQDAWVRQDMTKKLIQILFWQSTCGNAFAKVGWDVNKGKEQEIDSNAVDEDVLNQFIEMFGIEQAPEIIKVKTGELFIDPISPFNIAVDPLAGLFTDSEYVIETQIRSKDWIVTNYGSKWKDKISETKEIDVLIHPFVFIDDNEKVNRRGVVTHELFIRKGGSHSNGLHALMADDQLIVKPRDLPFDHGELPYVHFLEIYDPVSLWGTCAAQQVRPNQARYNRIQSVMTDHINLTSKVQWLIPKASGVREITNKPGENIFFSGGLAPAQTKPQAIPQYVENTLERTRRDMQDTASFHNVSQAQGEPGVRSGRAILALQDADDSVEGPVLQWLDRSLSDLGKLVIQTLNQFITEDQLIKVRGEFNELETLSYNGAMLQGESDQADYFDVRVKTFGRQLLSRSGKEQQIGRFIELGLLHPERDRTVIFNMLDTADSSVIFDEEAIDRTRQWQEIKRMQQPQEGTPPVQVLMGENHRVHLETLKKFIASSNRDKTDPKALEVIQKHALAHMQMQAAEIVQQQMIIEGALNNAGGTTGSGGQTGNNGIGGGQAAGAEAGANTARTGVNTSDSSDRF